MGLRGIEWQASVDGRPLVVARDEMSRGIEVSFEGQVVGRKAWSWIGTGTIEGTIERDGKSVPVRVQLSPPWRCRVFVDRNPLDVTKVR